MWMAQIFVKLSLEFGPLDHNFELCFIKNCAGWMQRECCQKAVPCLSLPDVAEKVI
jgi:hypothetical protein